MACFCRELVFLPEAGYGHAKSKCVWQNVVAVSGRFRTVHLVEAVQLWQQAVAYVR